MASNPTQFALLSRILHWLMAAMLLAMLFIGVGMVASLGNYHRLVAIHRPLGIMILILAAVRLVNRMFTTLPPFPLTMSQRERVIASASERLLYTWMFALPLVGWGMLSAGHYPIVMFGPVHLPPILPANPILYALLRKTHTILAYLLFLTFLAHFSAVLFHTLIIRDRLLDRMALWRCTSAVPNQSGKDKNLTPDPDKITSTTKETTIMRIGIAADHGGFELKEKLAVQLRAKGHEVVDFGARQLTPDDDYPDFVIPLAQAVAAGEVERGVAVCGSGVGAAICANKVKGTHACLIQDHFSAKQGVEDDHMNILCIGGRTEGPAVAWDLVQTFLASEFSQAARHLRRLGKVTAFETEKTRTDSPEQPG